MDCFSISFSGHAIRRMFERGIGREAILTAMRLGEEIAEYPDDARTAAKSEKRENGLVAPAFLPVAGR